MPLEKATGAETTNRSGQEAEWLPIRDEPQTDTNVAVEGQSLAQSEMAANVVVSGRDEISPDFRSADAPEGCDALFRGSRSRWSPIVPLNRRSPYTLRRLGPIASEIGATQRHPVRQRTRRAGHLHWRRL